MLLIVGWGATVHAQKGFNVGFRIVPMATAMYNQTDNDASETLFEWTPTYGVTAGLAGGYNFNNYVGIAVQALYANQGQHNYFSFVNNIGETVKIKNELRLRYFKFPLLFRINTNAQKKYAFSLELGPQFDLLSSVDERDFDPRYPANVPPNQHRPDHLILNFPSRDRTFQQINYAGVLAVGLDIKLRYNMKVVTSLRADYTFNDVEDKSVTYDYIRDGIHTVTPYYSPETRGNFGPDRAKSHNMTLGVSIGFNYLFLKKIDY